MPLPPSQPLVQQAGVAGVCGSALLSPSDSLLQQLQRLQLQQEAVPLLPAPLQPNTGWSSVGGSSAAVPVSIMPMLPAAGGDGGVLLDCGSLGPLSGLLSSLEEQAQQAQLQAANAQAVAAAATNNLAAVLSALGVAPAVQPAAGVCAGSPPAALVQQQRRGLPAAPPHTGSTVRRVGYPWTAC